MSSGYQSREEFRKQKQLDEARKAGTAAPERDEEGNEINPHIPQYIAKAPWYINRGGPSLKHQRIEALSSKGAQVSQWHQKMVTEKATKYRKGACENCGSVSHKVKDCLERKRFRGAKITGKDIAPDETVIGVSLDFEGKRDRWNGYEPSMFKEVVDHYAMVEVERRKIRVQELAKREEEEQKKKKQREEEKATATATAGVDGVAATTTNADDSDDSDEQQDEDKEHEDARFGMKSKTLVPHLRNREDTAKYLRNLALDSAYYDPKTRSMRENPNPSSNQSDVYSGDNSLRYSGDFVNFVEVQRFAWDASERGQDINPSAVPSQAELMFKTVKDRKQDLKNSQRSAIMSKYGGEQYLQKPTELDLVQTEAYVEYGPDGRIIGGKEKAIPKSAYEEDVYVNGHSTVWGSYWQDGKWGYACCKSNTRDSWCANVPVPSVSGSNEERGKKREADQQFAANSSKKQRTE